MKRFLTAILLLVTSSIFSQSVPQKMNYQAVARNSSGATLPNQLISVKAEILDADQSTVLYSETHSVTTNQFGLFTLQVGGGAILSGTFSAINWGSGNKYIRTSADLSGGTNYQVMGTSQLLSVAFALYSASSNTSTTQSILEKRVMTHIYLLKQF